MKRRYLPIWICVLFIFLFTSISVSAKEIKTLSQFPMSGPTGSLPEFGWGFIDGINWVNKEGGGVNGKQIKWYLEDMRYSPQVEVANFNKYAAEHDPSELVMASGYLTGALKPLINKINIEEKIPWLDGSYSTEIFGEEGGPDKYPYYYSLGATYGDQLKALVRWIDQNHKGGTPKVGVVYSPTAWGKDGLPEALDYARKLGMEIVAEIEYPYSATSATNECMTLRRARAEYIIYHGYSGATGHTAIFFKTASKILKDVQILGTQYTTMTITIAVVQDAFDGYIGVSTRPVGDAIPRSAADMSNPMIQLTHDFAKKYRPEEYKAGLKGGIKDIFLYMEGLTYAFILQKALTDADNAGEITRASIKEALDDLVWDFNGMFDGQTFSYKSHTIPMMRLYKANVKMVEMGGKTVPTGKLTPVGEWINANKVKW